MSTPPNFLEQLDAPEIDVRKKAIFQVGEKRLKEAVPKLIQLLATDADSVVRNSAARALGKIADSAQLEAIFTALITALQDPDYYVKSNACWSLGKLKDKRALPALMSMVDPKHRIYSMGGDTKTSKIIDETKASEKLKEEGMKFSDIIIEAIKAIGNIRDASGLPALLKALEDQDDGAVRCAACIALGDIGDKTATPHIIELLKGEKYWYVRRDAIKALARIKDPRAAEELVKKTADPFDEVRQSAVKALIAIGKPVQMEIFKLFLKNSQDVLLRDFIARNLTRDDIITILKHLITTEPDPGIRQTYEAYLTTMQPA